ncbi:MAG: hypothetical protein A2827_03555 [Candidatus Spechtbacteria bacterium RIFCSPHIGHO2_01_FULL_43_30]|uniref:Right handed beta helix domain-containing protein n=1 Tax=Candidatus Spechtbacteria bacterium RIFCSPHIGHO2_01_FULL_43_30 TaxID=1802158 RepID=A0A1G2H4B7_9BACT|nr:MAG: hypothetical protein A2827_03555 [Candidatus Spechtbacteria bacterium RIFCSPHIGHO2_01_FULL_43_30]
MIFGQLMNKNSPKNPINILPSHSKKKWVIFSVPLVVLFITIPAVFLRPSNQTLVKMFTKLDETPQIQELAFNILQARTSLQKSANIIHFPYWFKETKLPVYNLFIDPDDIRIMDDILPQNIFSDNLDVENRVFVNAVFQSGDFLSEADVRYRGALNSHWTHAKRSLLIKFPGDKLFQKMKAIDIIVPRDRAYLMELVNNSRLKRAGLVSPNMFFAWVKINNKDAGVYLVKERFSAGWLEKNSIAPDSEIFSQVTSVDKNTPYIDFNLYEYIAWTREINQTNQHFEELETLFYLFRQSDEIFYKNIANILDLEKWYGAIAMNILAGGSHSMEANLNLLFNSVTGKLEPLLEDIHIYEAEHNGDPRKAYLTFDPITKRILENQKFYEDYQKVLLKTVSEQNLKADLELYDQLYEQMKPEFYKDQTKYKGDIRVDITIKEMREWIMLNYKSAQKLANLDKFPKFDDIYKDLEDMLDLSNRMGFENFYDISLSKSEFMKKYPAFRIFGDNIVLPRGIYAINETVIIPQNTKLIIEPDVKIYLGEGVSVISYSPIEAVAQSYNPIIINSAYPDKPWGAVAIINANEASKFQYVSMGGGSASEGINGVTFTGMLTAHNAPLYVYDSNLSFDRDDDIINVKGSTGEIMRSKFYDSIGDAVDLDMTSGFIVQDNYFYNIGTKQVQGDAIDISFSDALVKNNKVDKCSDKGVSIGERSNPTITGNIIENCVMGIAVKDESSAMIENNVLSHNLIGLSLYQKKDIFGGGTAIIKNNTIENNEKNFDISKNSTILNP